MLAGAFYIYSAFNGESEFAEQKEPTADDWAPPLRDTVEEPPEATFIEPDAAGSADPVFDARYDDAAPRAATAKRPQPQRAEPEAATLPSVIEPSGAELYRQRQRTEGGETSSASGGAQAELARDASLAFGGSAAPIRPVWASKPSEEDLLTHYPPEALRSRSAGRVVLDCVITATLSTKCLIESEQPTGLGFGAAAMRVSQSFQSGPYLADRRPAAGEKVQLTIDFRPPR
jgi:hypothetical protein